MLVSVLFPRKAFYEKAKKTFRKLDNKYGSRFDKRTIWKYTYLKFFASSSKVSFKKRAVQHWVDEILTKHYYYNVPSHIYDAAFDIIRDNTVKIKKDSELDKLQLIEDLFFCSLIENKSLSFELRDFSLKLIVNVAVLSSVAIQLKNEKLQVRIIEKIYDAKVLEDILFNSSSSRLQKLVLERLERMKLSKSVFEKILTNRDNQDISNSLRKIVLQLSVENSEGVDEYLTDNLIESLDPYKDLDVIKTLLRQTKSESLIKNLICKYDDFVPEVLLEEDITLYFLKFAKETVVCNLMDRFDVSQYFKEILSSRSESKIIQRVFNSFDFFAYYDELKNLKQNSSLKRVWTEIEREVFLFQKCLTEGLDSIDEIEHHSLLWRVINSSVDRSLRLKAIQKINFDQVDRDALEVFIIEENDKEIARRVIKKLPKERHLGFLSDFILTSNDRELVVEAIEFLSVQNDERVFVHLLEDDNELVKDVLKQKLGDEKQFAKLIETKNQIGLKKQATYSLINDLKNEQSGLENVFEKLLAELSESNVDTVYYLLSKNKWDEKKQICLTFQEVLQEFIQFYSRGYSVELKGDNILILNFGTENQEGIYAYFRKDEYTYKRFYGVKKTRTI